MKTIDKKLLEGFLKKQNNIELEINEIYELMDEIEDVENKSIKEFYDNKEKYNVLIDYMKKYNSYDYNEFEYIYNIMNDLWDKEAIKNLDWYMWELQNFIFQLNIFWNTYIENIINYEMALDFLEESDLRLNTIELTEKLWIINNDDKIKFIEKRISLLIWMKNFKWPLKQITDSTFWLKYLFFYFGKTNWKFKKLSDFELYLYFIQLIFRYDRYTNWTLLKGVKIFDYKYLEKFNDYLLNNDLGALESFVKDFFPVIVNYPILSETKIFFRYILSLFNIFYLPNWEYKVWLIDDIKKASNLDEKSEFLLNDFYILIKELCDIVYKFNYHKNIENFKSKYDLTDEDYEVLKEFRFVNLFMSWAKVSDFFTNKKLKIIRNKLKNDDYFDILNLYWLYVSSICWSYAQFSKSDIKEIQDKIKKIDKESLSKFFLWDIDYIEESLDMIKI